VRRSRVFGALLLVSLLGFAGTCTFQHLSLTTVGGSQIFAGEVHNGTEANMLQHSVLVSFVNAGGTVLETQTVTPCLRSLPAGGVDFFSATSTVAAGQATAGLARVATDGTLKLGQTAAGSATFSGVAAKRANTALTTTGTVKNTDTAALASPVVCAVAYSAAGNVLSVGTGALSDLAAGASGTFSVTVLVPNTTGSADHVDLYVDGLKAGVPTAPSSSLGNHVVVGAAASPTKLGFTVQPPASTASATAMANIVVAIQTAGGTTVTTSTLPVTLAIANNAGPGGVLTCTSTLTVAAVSGLATFTGCKIDLIGTGYTLTASSAGLTSATSGAFNITLGAATKVVFTVQPGGGTGGTAWGTQPTAAIEDAGGNVVTTDNASTVTLAIGTNAGPGGVLACTLNPKTVAAGVAAFAGCNITLIGTGYTLTATSGALTVATSSAFNITLGAASQVIVGTQPSGAALSGVAFAQQPVFRLADAGGNTLTTDSASTITLTLTAVSGGPGTLACTLNPKAVTAGVVTFAGCNITTAGTYTITATSSLGGVTTVTTVSIVIT